MTIATRFERTRRMVTSDMPLKLLSLFIALILFSFVNGTRDEQRSVLVDVAPILPKSSSRKILISDLPEKVKITLQGSRWVLNSVLREGIDPVEIDLANIRHRYFYFDKQAIEVPAGARVVQIEPGSIPLTWADQEEREIAVVPKFTGPPLNGCRIASDVAVEPAKILARGPQFEVEGLRRIETLPIDVRTWGLGRHVERVQLARPTPHVSLDSTWVQVTAEVIEPLEESALHEMPISVSRGVNRSRLMIQPGAVSFAVRGTPSALKAVHLKVPIPHVDITSAKPGDRVSIQFRDVPAGAEVVRVSPAQIEVVYDRVK